MTNNAEGKSTEQDCYDFLDRIGVSYKVVRHRPVYTVEEAMAAPELVGHTEIKNLFIQDDKGKRFYLVIMPGLKRLDLRQLATDLGEKKVRFCSSEKVERMLGVQPGSVSIFCALNASASDVQLVVDKELETMSELCFHPIVNTATVIIASKDVSHILADVENEFRVIAL